MMNSADYRHILDFFFSESEVSDELKRKFSGWLRVHGEEPKVKELLEEYWLEMSSTSSEFDVSAGLERLMAEVNPDAEFEIETGLNCGDGNCRETGAQETSSTVKSVASFFSSKVVRFCAGVAAAIVLFFAGSATTKIMIKLEKETVLMASSESIGSYRLPDGTKVWLNKDSWLKYDQDFGNKKRKVSIDGEGYFEVAKDAGRPFIVEMHTGQKVKVLGTTFNVCSYSAEDDTEVVLCSGSVQISGLDDEQLVTLVPNQKFRWNGGAVEISDVNAGDCYRWYERKLVFDNVMLKDILENLSHRCHIKIDCRSSKLAQKRMSLTVRDEPINEILDVLSILLPAEWALQGDQIIIDNKTKKH